MFDRVKTFVLVSVLALLVWVFAESESLQADVLTVDVRIESGSETRYVSIPGDADWTGRLKIELRGGAANMDAVRQRLTEPVVLTAARGEIPDEPGRHQVALRDALRRSEVFGDSGVTIVETDPGDVSVEVDRLVTTEARVRVEVSDAQLAVPAVAQPSRVTIRLPESLRGSLTGDVEVVARVPGSAVANLVPGRATPIPSVPVELPGELRGKGGVTLLRETVSLTLTLASRRESYEYSTLPVHVAVSGVLTTGFRFELGEDQQFLTGVRVSGPADQIERIRRGDVEQALAVVVIGPDAVAGVTEATELSLPIRLTNLPAGVQGEVGDVLIRVRVTPRSSASAGGEGPAGGVGAGGE
ncbi:MAG: hypothetical protein ACF8Q5_07930 [Phycisphaerales bacterium JB040]